MPLTLTVTEGALPAGADKTALRRLTEAFLRWHGLSGNQVLTPNVIGSVHVLPADSLNAGMESAPVAVIEWKTPSFAFATREVQLGYIAEATDVVHELSGGRLPRERIWVNVVHAVDGTWGIGGRAFTNAELAEAISLG